MDNTENNTNTSNPQVTENVTPQTPSTNNPNKTNTSQSSVTNSMPTDPIVAAIIIWVLGIIGPLLYWTHTDNYLRQNAKEAMLLQGVLLALSLVVQFFTIISGIFGAFLTCVLALVSVGYVVLIVMKIIKMQNREEFLIPVISDYAKKI